MLVLIKSFDSSVEASFVCDESFSTITLFSSAIGSEISPYLRENAFVKKSSFVDVDASSEIVSDGTFASIGELP